jgi:hypothetical protein
MKHFVNYGFLFLLVVVIASCHTTYKEIGFGGGLSIKKIESEKAGKCLDARMSAVENDNFALEENVKVTVTPNATNNPNFKLGIKNESQLKYSVPKVLSKINSPIIKQAFQKRLKTQMNRVDNNSKGLNLLLISLGLFVIGGLIINTNNYAGLLLGIIVCGVATIVLTVAAFTFLVGLIIG